jgi:hypothetical protein
VIAYLDYKKNEWLYYDTGYDWPVMEIPTSSNSGKAKGRFTDSRKLRARFLQAIPRFEGY